MTIHEKPLLLMSRFMSCKGIDYMWTFSTSTVSHLKIRTVDNLKLHTPHSKIVTLRNSSGILIEKGG
jgi:hypothetical protein